MGYLESNLEAVKQNSYLQSLIEDSDLPTGRRVRESKSGVPTVHYLKDEHWRSITSAYDPKLEAQQQIDSITDWDVSLFFVVGEAGFYHVEEIFNRVSEQTVVVFLSNQPAYLRLLFETRDLSKLLVNKRFVIVSSWSVGEIRAGIQHAIEFFKIQFPTFAYYCHPIEKNIQMEFVNDIEKFLAWTFKTLLVNFNTSASYEGFWAKNFICNAPYIYSSKSAALFGDSWNDKPLIIVGAGPSLNKNIETLREAKGKALILCVDTAFRSLEAHGIEPDVIVTIDGTPGNAHHLASSKYGDIPLLTDTYAHYDILSNHRGAKIFTDSVGFHKEWWKMITHEEPVNSLASGGSVATVAFSFARYIGANPVIMMGVDLAYTGGMYYASGTLHDRLTLDDVISDHRQVIEVTDIYGNPVYTTYDYHYYLQWFEDHSYESLRTYINCTEGGALKGGFQIMTLKDALQKYCSSPLDVQGWMHALGSVQIESEKAILLVQNLEKSRREIRALVRYTSVLIKQLQEFSERIQLGDLYDSQYYIARIQDSNRRIGELKLALAFLGGQSLLATWKDKIVESAIQRERESMDPQQLTLTSARRTLSLFINFRELATNAIELHNEALQIVYRVFDLDEHGGHFHAGYTRNVSRNASPNSDRRAKAHHVV